MSSPLLRLVRPAVSIGLLVLLAWWIVDLRELWRILQRLQPSACILALALVAGDRVLMAFKWWLLLRVRKIPLDLWTTIRAYFATTFAGLFLPVTLGADAIRVLAARRLGVHDVAASIVIERSLGLIAMASVALVSSSLLAASVASLPLKPVVFSMLALVACGSIGFLASLIFAGRWTRQPPAGQLGKVLASYAAYRQHPGTLIVFYGLSVLESLIPVVVNYVTSRGLGLRISIFVLAATLPVALTIARLPISIGGLGVQQLTFVYLAGLLGVPSADALATMLVADAVLILTLLPSAFDVSMLSLPRRPLAR